MSATDTTTIPQLRACPECHGWGDMWFDGAVFECGVCCGDRFIWPDDGTKPDWLRDRFRDHSWHGHRCDFCQSREVSA